MGKSAATKSPAVIRTTNDPGKSPQRQKADTLLSSALQSAIVVEGYSKNLIGDLDITDLYEAIGDKADTMRSGNLNAVEMMLFNQAQALQGIFTSMARRAAMNAGEYLGAADTYLRLALKAQAQCRATLETLAEIKNPQPTAFIRQQNIAANQQVNNGTATIARAHAGESGNPANELKAVNDESRQRLDFGTTAAAGAGDTAMATLGKVDRS